MAHSCSPTTKPPRILEGAWGREKVVLLSFADEASFRARVNSPEYREIPKHRKAGADTIVLLVKGVS